MYWLYISIFGAICLGCSLVFNAIRPGTQKLFPLYLPIEIITIMIATECSGIVSSVFKYLRQSRYLYCGLLGKHYYADSLASPDRFLCQPAHTLDNLPLLWTTHVRCFGGETSQDTYDKFLAHCRELLVALEKHFLGEKNSTNVINQSNVEAKVTDLVSLSVPGSEKDRNPTYWEQYANSKQVSPDAVEIDFARVVRDLTAHVALEVIYGRDFLHRNPRFINDMWIFADNSFDLLLILGFPRWTPLGRIRVGVAACERIRAALMTYYKRVEQHQRGQPVDGADMSDVSATVLERSSIYLDKGFTLRQRADLDMGVAFSSITNTPVLSFWYFVQLYSRPELLSNVRDEVATHVTIARNPATGKSEISSINHAALYNECPLFKSGLFETARLLGGSTPIRYVNRSTHATTTAGATHVLQPGIWVTIPSGNVQMDPHVYPNPSNYVPDRFIVDEDGKQAARFGQLRIFGGGAGVCKGKTYAIKEALSMVAGIISLWDIEALDGSTVLPPPKDNNKIPSRGWKVRVRRR